MRAVIQRVSSAKVEVDNRESGSIKDGLLVLLGVHKDDTDKDLMWMVNKVKHLRVFEDQKGLMNRSVVDTGGSLLVVSQFTLYGDCRKGRRPSWNQAAPPEKAEKMYDDFTAECIRQGLPTQTGTFQAMMEVTLTNDGPVTLLLDSHKQF